MYEYYFENRKPSKKQIMAKVNEAMKQQENHIEISWGENMLTLMRQYNGLWQGFGWIKGIGADDIAKDLNKAEKRQLLNLWNT
jgi:hypothetical protein